MSLLKPQCNAAQTLLSSPTLTIHNICLIAWKNGIFRLPAPAPTNLVRRYLPWTRPWVYQLYSCNIDMEEKQAWRCRSSSCACKSIFHLTWVIPYPDVRPTSQAPIGSGATSAIFSCTQLVKGSQNGSTPTVMLSDTRAPFW